MKKRILSFDESSNMQVSAPPEEKPMDQLMPEVGVPSQPFAAKEVLMVRPYYLGKEKKYPLTSRILASVSKSSTQKLLDLENVEKGLKENFQQISQYLKEGVYSIPVESLEAYDVLKSEDPGNIRSDSKGIWIKVLKGDRESWEPAETSDLRIQAGEILENYINELTSEISKIIPEAYIELGKIKSEFIIWLVFPESSLPEAKVFAGVMESVYEEPAMEAMEQYLEKLKIQTPSEFWPSYEGKVKLLAEEHGIGDILGYSFFPDSVGIVGTEKLMLLHYDDLQFREALELYNISQEEL